MDDPVHRSFEGEVEAGRILVVVDIPEESIPAVRSAIIASGAKPLPFERPTMIT